MTQTQTPTDWRRAYDKYGRSAQHFHGWTADGTWRALGAVVKMPQAALDRNPDERYLANDWLRNDDSVTYHLTLKAAKAHVESKVTTYPRPVQ